MATITLNFNSVDYTSNKPTYGLKENYNSNAKFVNKTEVLRFDNSIYGIVRITISFTGNIDYGSVYFSNPNGGKVSSSTNIDGAYTTTSSVYVKDNIFYQNKSGGTTTYYVIVNSDPLTQSDSLFVSIALGKDTLAPSSSSVTIDFDCIVPIYKYTTKLHVYSPYDARDNELSKLSTILYSRISIDNWNVGTKVYNDELFGLPALPYFYGYGQNVYQVGDVIDRSYGFKTEYTIKSRLINTIFKSKPKITSKTSISLTYDPVIETSEACVTPLINRIGEITKIILSSSLLQPTQYRYYLGYNNTIKQESNDSVFTTYDFGEKKHIPITGSMHAINKVIQSITVYSTYWDPGILNAIKSGLASLPLLFPLLFPSFAEKVGEVVGSFLWDYLLGPLEKVVTSIFGELTLPSIVIPGWVPIVAAISAIIYMIYQLFKTRTEVLKEPCRQFLHHFTNTPYIELNCLLSRDKNLTIFNNGYYCDGVYFYQQTGSGIISKELSSCYTRTSNDPVMYENVYSLQADNPTLVTDFLKLMVLSYTSGNPMPKCGGNIYYSTYMSYDVTSSICCELEICLPYKVEFPSGMEWSCISVEDANLKLKERFDSAVAFMENKAQFNDLLPENDLGDLIAIFTHELKIENNPTLTGFYYDKRITETPNIGTKLYFDPCGCNKVLDGYYAVAGEKIGISDYLVFYHAVNGAVDRIYYMQSSNSTTTTTSEPILKTYLDYSSNWFLNGINSAVLSNYTYGIETNRQFNPNSMYNYNSNNNNNPLMVKGFINNLTKLEDNTWAPINDFKKYTGATESQITESNTGWYIPLIDWIDKDPFCYYKAQTITLNTEEVCDYLIKGSTLRGFNIVAVDSSLILTPTINEVNVTAHIYANGNGIIASYNCTTSASNAKTFIQFDNQIGKNDVINNIVLEILQPNPINKISYNPGTFTSCNLSASGFTLPSVTLISVSKLSSTTATVNGYVTSSGGVEVFDRGFVFGTSNNPTLSDSFVSADKGIGQFSSVIFPLNEFVLYYIRAYATNVMGTSYSNVLSYSSSNVCEPLSLTYVTHPDPGVYWVNFNGGGENCSSVQMEYSHNQISWTSNMSGCSSPFILTGLSDVDGTWYFRAKKICPSTGAFSDISNVISYEQSVPKVFLNCSNVDVSIIPGIQYPQPRPAHFRLNVSHTGNTIAEQTITVRLLTNIEDYEIIGTITIPYGSKSGSGDFYRRIDGVSVRLEDGETAAMWQIIDITNKNDFYYSDQMCPCAQKEIINVTNDDLSPETFNLFIRPVGVSSNCGSIIGQYSRDGIIWTDSSTGYMNCDVQYCIVEVPQTNGKWYFRCKSVCTDNSYSYSNVVTYLYCIENYLIRSIDRDSDSINFIVNYSDNLKYTTKLYGISSLSGQYSRDGNTWYDTGIPYNTVPESMIITPNMNYMANQYCDMSFSTNNYVLVWYFRIKKTCSNGNVIFSNQVSYTFSQSEFISNISFTEYPGSWGPRANDQLKVIINGHDLGTEGTISGVGYPNQMNLFATMSSVTRHPYWYDDTFSNLQMVNFDPTFLNIGQNIITLDSVNNNGGRNIFYMSFREYLIINNDLKYYINRGDAIGWDFCHGCEDSKTFIYPFN